MSTGGLAQILPTQTGILCGFDVALGRTIVLLHFGRHNTTLRNGFTDHNQEWQAGMRVQTTLFDVGFGRVLYDGAHTRLIPFLGYRLLDLSPRDRNDERYKGFSLVSHTPTAGLIWDVKVAGNMARPDRVEDHFWFVRTKLSVSPVLAPKSLSGGLINLQISVGGFGRPRRVRYQPERTTIVMPESLI